MSRGGRPEAGTVPLVLLEAATLDPVFRHAPRDLLRPEWQGEVFEPPPGSVRLAASPVCSAAVFRWGSAAYGLQLHIEVSSASERSHANASAYVQAPRGDGQTNRHAGEMVRAWLALVASWSERKQRNLLFQTMPR